MLSDISVDIDLVGDHALTEIEYGQLAHATLVVSIKSGLYDLLINQPRTISEIANVLKWSTRVVEALVTSLVAMGFLEVEDNGRFHPTMVAQTYLVSNSPYFRKDFLFSPLHENGYVDKLWHAISESRGSILKPSPQTVNKEEMVDAQHWIDAQHYEAIPKAVIVAKHPVFNCMKRLLDVGGADGTYAMEIVRGRPSLHCTVMDCESSCRFGELRTKEAGLSDQITFIPKDMFNDPWPVHLDGVFFSNIFHDWGSERTYYLARCSFDALKSGGSICVHEALLNEKNSGPIFTALLSVLMLIGTEHGKQFSLHEIENILLDTGFCNVKYVPSFGHYSMITANKE